jgi:hypothetical protein
MGNRWILIDIMIRGTGASEGKAGILKRFCLAPEDGVSRRDNERTQ